MNEVSLRDYFAAKAMQSYLLDTELRAALVAHDKSVEKEIAELAYRMADVMSIERLFK